jgi:hypothetical protein
LAVLEDDGLDVADVLVVDAVHEEDVIFEAKLCYNDYTRVLEILLHDIYK